MDKEIKQSGLIPIPIQECSAPIILFVGFFVSNKCQNDKTDQAKIIKLEDFANFCFWKCGFDVY